MAIISWGRALLELAKNVDDVIGTFIALPIPKQGTTELSTEAGNKTEALEEGGGVVDVRYDKSKYSLTFQLFAKRGSVRPISDVDGVITDHYAIRLTPEDPTLPGFIMEKCSVSVLTTWSAEDGELWQYTFDGLVPASGNILKPYIPDSADEEPGG
jgi:hypothetical protein